MLRGVRGGQRQKGKSWGEKKAKSKKIFVLWDGLSLSQSAVVAGQTYPWLLLEVLVTLTVENESEGLFSSPATRAVFNERLISPPFVIAPIFSDFLFMV